MDGLIGMIGWMDRMDGWREWMGKSDREEGRVGIMDGLEIGIG